MHVVTHSEVLRAYPRYFYPSQFFVFEQDVSVAVPSRILLPWVLSTLLASQYVTFAAEQSGCVNLHLSLSRICRRQLSFSQTPIVVGRQGRNMPCATHSPAQVTSGGYTS